MPIFIVNFTDGYLHYVLSKDIIQSNARLRLHYFLYFCYYLYFLYKLFSFLPVKKFEIDVQNIWVATQY